MELTLRITDMQRLTFLIEVLQALQYVEIVSMKEDQNSEIPESHKKLLNERIERIENGQTTFRSWNEIKQKYERAI